MNNQFERAFDEIFCSDDFKQGKLDCKNGVPHKTGASSEYTRGYSHQYEQEQKDDAKQR